MDDLKLPQETTKETKFKRAVRLLAALAKRNLMPPIETTEGDMRTCRCGRPKMLSHTLCFECQDALLVIRKRYADKSGVTLRTQTPPRLLERQVAAPPMEREQPLDMTAPWFDDVVKLYEADQ
jgi:hypothetical protein